MAAGTFTLNSELIKTRRKVKVTSNLACTMLAFNVPADSVTLTRHYGKMVEDSREKALNALPRFFAHGECNDDDDGDDDEEEEEEEDDDGSGGADVNVDTVVVHLFCVSDFSIMQL